MVTLGMVYGIVLPKLVASKDPIRRSPNEFSQVLPPKLDTIWLFNIAMENHHF
jgi:hypothetical protein